MALPTETVYGLAGLALETASCRSIFSIKGRPLVDPLIVHVSGLEMAARVAEVTPEAQSLAAKYWPGPLTLILRKKPAVPDIVTAGLPTVAVRMPRHPVARDLLGLLKAPLAAPSANPFGYVSPSSAQHVADSFGERVPFIIDGGPCEIGIESTIVDLTHPDSPEVLRPGAISPEEIGQILDQEVVLRKPELEESEVASAPGTFSRHYSPGTPLDLFPEGSIPDFPAGSALLCLKRPESKARASNVFWLSEDGDPAEISRSLFHLLRQLDQSGYNRILCEQPARDAKGILLAVRDRLARAAAK